MSNSTSDAADLICEAILREMARARRFSTCTDAWSALLNVRRIADSIQNEANGDQTAKIPSIGGSQPS